MTGFFGTDALIEKMNSFSHYNDFFVTPVRALPHEKQIEVIERSVATCTAHGGGPYKVDKKWNELVCGRTFDPKPYEKSGYGLPWLSGWPYHPLAPMTWDQLAENKRRFNMSW